MEKATAYFGVPPRLLADVSDSAGVLRPADLRAMRRSISEFARRFPQAGFTAAFMALERDVPGAAYAWWIFNRCHPAGAMRQASANRHLFLLVDTAGRDAWLTLGYGLEPFVSEAQLRHCLERAQPHFAKEAWTAGVAALLKEAEEMLREVATSLPRVFGLTDAAQPVNPEPAAA